MATFLEFTSKGFPSDGSPGPFSFFWKCWCPLYAMLFLPGLTIGLFVWLFSTLVLSSVSTLALPSPSLESCHDNSKVDPSPSSPVSSPYSSTSPSESFKCINQEAKKKKKMMKKKKKLAK